MMEIVTEEKRKEQQRTNIGCLLAVLVIIVGLVFWVNAGSKSSPKQEESTVISSVQSEEKDPYEVMNIAFEGYPDKEDIQPMLEAVMERYSYPVTNENVLNTANMLVVLRKESKVGVTEMEILKHMYQKGSASLSMQEQAAVSSIYLEKNK